MKLSIATIVALAASAQVGNAQGDGGSIIAHTGTSVGKVENVNGSKPARVASYLS